ncbi:MAG: glycine oxidase [Actinomycetota bacterium]|jgi:glycine oxidase|nr:glycine oxidase [Actinomycetota bacterium]
MAANRDVAIIGGGVIGAAIGWECVRRGLSVTLIDEEPGEGASSVAAGMLAPVTELHYGENDLLAFNLRSASLFPEWVDELEEATGSDVGFRRTGTIMVARDADEHASLQRVWQHQTSLDLKAERLRGSETISLEPGLSTRIRSGVLVPDDHQVDPDALTRALLRACSDRGVSFVANKVTSLSVEENAVVGLQLNGGEKLACRRVVIAAGCRSGEIGGLPNGVVIPVRPVKGQLVELRSPSGTPIIERNVRGADVYLVPRRDGRLVVGATVEELGFDTTVTAGAVLELLRDAYELVPGVAELEVTRLRAGLRPGTPDNAPLIGPLGVDGAFLATGHFRNGVLLAPATALAVAEMLAEGDAEDVSAFDPRRFDGTSHPAA